MGGRFKREETYVCLWLIHVAVWQKTTQCCKAIILQLKKKRESIQINKVRNVKEVALDTTEIQWLIRDYYKELQANKMYNLEEMKRIFWRGTAF